MATQSDVRRIALALPGACEEEGRFAFSVQNKGKGLVWVWLERTDPEQARVSNPEVVAVRVRDQAERAVNSPTSPE